MPRILIDISRLCYRRLAGRLPTGIDRVSLEYIRRYGSGARAVLTRGPFSSVLSPADSARAFGMLLDPAASPQAFRLFVAAYLRWWAGHGARDHVLLNAGHSGLEYPGYAASLRRGGALPVIFVHDLIPVTHPEYFPAGEKARHVARMRTALTVGRGIIVNSQFTLDELGRFAAKEGLAVPPAVVAPLASGLPRAEAGPRPIPEPYFVIVGTIEPRKNHLLLLQLWRAMAARCKTQDSRFKGDDAAVPRLVVIGHRGHESEGVVDLLERCRQLQGVVIEKDRCSDTELATYLRHAQALLFPTFVEGYGIPVAEALALGTPVIASDLPVFREIAGEIPEYVDSLDGKRWMEIITDYARPDSPRRAAQLKRMKGFQPTTWDEHFRAVDAFLGTIVKRES